MSAPLIRARLLYKFKLELQFLGINAEFPLLHLL